MICPISNYIPPRGIYYQSWLPSITVGIKNISFVHDIVSQHDQKKKILSLKCELEHIKLSCVLEKFQPGSSYLSIFCCQCSSLIRNNGKAVFDAPLFITWLKHIPHNTPQSMSHAHLWGHPSYPGKPDEPRKLTHWPHLSELQLCLRLKSLMSYRACSHCKPKAQYNLQKEWTQVMPLFEGY